LEGELSKVLGYLLIFAATTGVLSASITAVPEIGPAGAIGAIAMLSGGLLILRARRKRQSPRLEV
jgi:hypothetical protein